LKNFLSYFTDIATSAQTLPYSYCTIDVSDLTAAIVSEHDTDTFDVRLWLTIKGTGPE
jgi:hypothetical protein